MRRFNSFLDKSKTLMSNRRRQTSVSVTSDRALTLYKNLETKSEHRGKNLTSRVGNQPDNLPLNRWQNVLPYDSTRVTLDPPYPGKIDYINASYVSVQEADRYYILTQGPLKDTVWHFWYMVLTSKSRSIVMLCKLVENGMCKCSKYWPDSTNPDDVARDPFSGIEIRLLSEEEMQEIVIRKIELRHLESNTIRIITQYHYNKWPDFGVPSDPTTFLELLQMVSREQPSVWDQPNIVHCSAGIGRSGSFCLVDSCIQIMEKRQKSMTREEIIETLVKLRLCRPGLVQTSDQLRFSLRTISMAIKKMDFIAKQDDRSSKSQGSEVCSSSSAREVFDASTITHTRKRSTGDQLNPDQEIKSACETKAKRSKGSKA